MSLNTILATAPLTATGYHLKATGTALGQSLIWDNGTNVGIGNTNTSYTLDVSGTGRFTSTLLVSGAATFSSDLSVINTSNALLKVYSNTTSSPIADIELMRGTNTTWGADAYTDYRIRSSGGDLLIQSGESTVTSTRLTIASTGAATFSSSVTINSSSVLKLGNSDNASTMQIWNSQSGAANNFLIYDNAASAYRFVISSSGLVGIGTSSPAALLETRVAGEGPATGKVALIAATSNGINDIFRWYDGTTQLGVFKNSGNVGIGTSSPSSLLHAYVNAVGTVTVARFAAANYSSPSSKTYIQIGTQYDDGSSRIGSSNPSSNLSELFFETATTASGVFAERMRITSGGAISVNSGLYYSGEGCVNTLVSSVENFCYSGTNTNATTPRGFYLNHSNTTAGDYSFYFTANGSPKFYVTGNGAIYSTSNSITLITSDVKLKTDIKDYDKGLSEILAMKPRYFKYKNNLEVQQTGFIAQEMEEALAGSMIDVADNLDSNETHKSYQIDWYPLLVKAIQEMNTKLNEQNQTIQNLQEQINILAK